MEKIREKLRPFMFVLLFFAFLVGSPVAANEGEDTVLPHPAVACLSLRDTGDKCTFTGGLMWWYLGCENVLVDPGPPCGS